MSQTKIVLSDKELEMVNDSEWILTKHRIIHQVYTLLESVVEDIDILILPNWSSLSQQPTSLPRIFKGENYLGLPYVTLDYPKRFNAENTLTIRTMFWWGNFLSVTLHAGKIYQDLLIEKLRYKPAGDDLYICVHDNQWHHHFEPDNYELFERISLQDLEKVSGRDFIKIAYRIKLVNFDELRLLLCKHYQMLADIMA